MNYNLAAFTAAAGTAAQLPKSTRPEVAFAGRSNVGKSSLLNKLFNRKSLVKVSSRPGKTTTINFFNVGDVDFVDLPGYGFARVSDADASRWEGLMAAYFESGRRIALAVALVDIRHDLSPLDAQMVDYLLAHEVPFAVVFTKADKLSRQRGTQQAAKLARALQLPEGVPTLMCSASSGTGIDELKRTVAAAVARLAR